MSNISKFTHIFAITLFAITVLNCSVNNSEIPPQIPSEENSCKNLQRVNINNQEEMSRILEKCFKTERKKLKKDIQQAKEERKKAKPSQFLYYIAETLPFGCLAIAPAIASIPLINQALNKFPQIPTKSSSQDSNNNKNTEMNFTSHLLCLTIAKLLNLYVEKQALTEEFHKGRVKTLEDNLQEKKKNKNNNI